MKTVQFPPICPFGNSEDDGLKIDLVEAAVHLFPITPENDVFLRVNTYAEDGSVSYFIGNRRAVQDDILDRLEAWGDLKQTPEDVALLRKWKLNRLVKRLK